MKAKAKTSTHPVLPVRVSPEVLELVDTQATSAGVTRAAMAETLINEALEARGENPPAVDHEAKEARKAVMDLKKTLGSAVEKALEAWNRA